MSDVARYYHTSLYAFNPQARSAVVSTFNQVVQDVAVRCWYDGAQETFLIECPTALGSVADEALTAIVMKYIEQELDDAESEEREPNIIRFPESRLDALDSFLETQDPTEGENDPISTARIISGRPSVTHLVIVGAVEGKILRFFRLDQLPGGLLERTLAPFNERAQRVVNDGLTCRAVRWNDETGRHVFNGRTGTDCAITTVPMDDLKLPEFSQLHDRRTLQDDSGPTATWIHVGSAPTVEKWVRGIGETRQHDPEEKAEMPKDARNLIAATKSYAIGRARIPKGDHVIEEDSAYEASEAKRPLVDAFDNLMSGDMGEISGSDDSDFDEAEHSTEPAFADLLDPSGSSQVAKSTKQSAPDGWDVLVSPVKAWDITRPPVAPIVLRAPPLPQHHASSSRQQYESFPALGSSLPSRRQTPISVRQPQAEYSPPPQSLPRQRAVTRTSQKVVIRRENASGRDEESPAAFPSYGKDFAGVDAQGLHAPAAAAARWQNENYEDRKTKSKCRAIALRGREVSGSGILSMSEKSDSSEQGPQTGMRGSEARASSSTLVEPPVPREPDWFNTVVQPRVRSGRLVDDRSQFHDRLPDAPPGLHAIKTIPMKREQEALTIDRTASAGQLIDVVGNVLEVLPSHPSANMSGSMPGSMQKLLIPGLSPAVQAMRRTHRAGNDESAEDVIVERLQTLPADYTTKRNTMRQKARNKAKKGLKIGSKSTGKKIELPLPSPPPPPRPKPAPELQIKRQKSHLRASGVQSQSASTSRRAPVAPPMSSIISGAHPFGQALLDLRQHVALRLGDAEADINVGPAQPQVSIKLSCQIGIVLVRGLEKSLSKCTIGPELLQHKLNDSSVNIKRDLLGRVTTSTAEAQALIGIMSKGDGPVAAGAEYHIVIRDDTGSFLTIIVPSDDKENYTIESQAQVLTEVCAHFPTRVWDARYTLLQPASEVDTPASKAVKEFVASIQTTDNAPSFMAMISNTALTVERVHIKKIFSQTTDEISMKVVQVQDLIIGRIDLKHHNFEAIAQSEERMTEEQRLWWEVSLETVQLGMAEELQSRVNEVICSMDHIGVENQGPWVRLEEGDEEQRPAAPEGTIWW
ncbi:hypothetical protein DOTSEDRAFT_49032 [Dothistroma septosporum NZE10]|uniref:Uncharacterized protein n=1 Tax=Dothistroma septosporum (strain NZE10 / CBS 128990) TaxID=675120 RepID=N1PYK0_DOTSN|nr:hypothetical protein DOTSEDRAFT_49032 [Dothistroma septosporum NZE10]